MLKENMELKKIFSSPDPIEMFFTIVFFINIIGLFICLICYFIFWREINGIEYKNITEIIKKLNSNNNFEAIKIKKYIKQAINDNKITKWEYDKIQDMINKYRKRKAKQEALQQIENSISINKRINTKKDCGKIPFLKYNGKIYVAVCDCRKYPLSRKKVFLSHNIIKVHYL